MFSLVVVLIILGCAAYQFFQGTFVKAFVMMITSICAGAAAFGYFELLANVLINQKKFVSWAQTISFALLFVLTFAVLQIIAARLTRWPIDFGLLAERVGRVICGIFSGLILSGILLTALAMAPLSNKLPYQRFDAENPNAENPHKALLNADGFATGWFSMMSKGSLSGKKSFAALHPDFIDQVFLNRLNVTKGVVTTTSTKAITAPRDKAIWPAPAELKDSNGKPISPKSGHNLTIARVGITKEAVRERGIFTASQLRLICKQKSDAKKPLSGKAKNIYPIGYLKTPQQLQLKKLNDQIEVEPADISGKARWIDFAFYVPNKFVPVLAEFKQNSVVQLPPPVTAEQAPTPALFIQRSKCAIDIAELQPISSAKIYGVELAAGTRLLNDLPFKIEDPNHWQTIQTPNSIKPAQFEDEMINHVRAELKIEKLIEAETKKTTTSRTTQRRTSEGRRIFRKPTRSAGGIKKKKGIREMLEPLKGYKLLSLKCSNPSTGTAISADQLPVLIELSGSIHHPVGIIALGKVDDRYICEFDYCSLPAENDSGCLNISEDGSVTQPFPDNIWLPEKTQEILGFYALYMIKAGKNATIMAVKPADSDTAAGFKEHEGFLIN